MLYHPLSALPLIVVERPLSAGMVVYSFYIFDRHGNNVMMVASICTDGCSGLHLQAKMAAHSSIIGQIVSTGFGDDDGWDRGPIPASAEC